jgi:hypothetical protein
LIYTGDGGNIIVQDGTIALNTGEGSEIAAIYNSMSLAGFTELQDIKSSMNVRNSSSLVGVNTGGGFTEITPKTDGGIYISDENEISLSETMLALEEVATRPAEAVLATGADGVCSVSLDVGQHCLAYGVPLRDENGDIIVPDHPTSGNSAIGWEYARTMMEEMSL